MKKKVLIAVISAVVLVAAACVIFLFVKSRPPKAPKGTKSFTAKQYRVENGRKILLSVTKEHYDERGNLIYANDKAVGEEPRIFHFEYDELNRITMEKEMKKIWFGEVTSETVYYQYEGDSNRITESKTVWPSGKTVVRTYRYDEKGQRVYEKVGSDYTIESVYNDRGVEISKIIRTADLILIEKEYNEETLELSCYESFYPKGKEYPDGKTGALISISRLNEDGRIAETIGYLKPWDAEDGEEPVPYEKSVFTYYSGDETLDYEEYTYDMEGVIKQYEVFDKNGREVCSRDYENGVEERSSETEYDVELPEYPNRKMEILKSYRYDETGEKKLISLTYTWKPDGQPFQSVVGAGRNPRILLWDKEVDGKMVTQADTLFSDDGMLKEWRSYSSDGGKSIHYYDRYGNPTKTEEYDADGKITGEYVIEYKYY